MAAAGALAEASGYEAMAKEIKDTMSELRSKGDLLSGFRREYEKLYQALEKVRCRSLPCIARG